jgi:hypothetical protein
VLQPQAELLLLLVVPWQESSHRHLQPLCLLRRLLLDCDQHWMQKGQLPWLQEQYVAWQCWYLLPQGPYPVER